LEESIYPVQVRPQIAFPILSAGKPLAAIVIAVLEDRGALDVEEPIAEIFPEFGRHGKERITTLDVLTHRSGLLMPDFVQKMDLWGDRAAVQRALADTVPSRLRGTLAYGPHEYGWILSEVVLRVDGRSLAAFYDFLIGGGRTASGQRLISERAIRLYISQQLLAWDRSLKTPMAVGRGFVVGTLFPSSFG
jgi:CubicO group peptidase (beta-lactamase class C family)